MNSKTLFLLVVALICGTITSFGVKLVFFNTSEEDNAGEAVITGPMGEIVVAKTDLMAGDELNAQNIRIALVPEKEISQDAVFNFDSTVTHRVLRNIAKDTPLSIFDLELIENQEETVSYTQPGYAVVPIQIEQIVTSGDSRNYTNVLQLDQLIRPGDQVSLTVTQEDISADRNTTGASRSLRKLVNKTLIDSIPVYSIVCEPKTGKVGNSDDKISTVSFMMNKEEEDLVQNAMVSGKIRLVVHRETESFDIDATSGLLQKDNLFEVMTPAVSGNTLYKVRKVSSENSDSFSAEDNGMLVPLQVEQKDGSSATGLSNADNGVPVMRAPLVDTAPVMPPVVERDDGNESDRALSTTDHNLEFVEPLNFENKNAENANPAPQEKKDSSSKPVLPRVFAPRQNLSSFSNSEIILNDNKKL